MPELPRALGTQLAVAVCLLCCAPFAAAQSVRAGDYTVRLDAEGRLTLDCRRLPVVTTSYAGMFGTMPGGSPVYWVGAGRRPQVKATAPGAPTATLTVRNEGDRGVTLTRTAELGAEGLRLTHEVAVPAGVAGSIDTGFTLNPELVFDGPGVLTERPGQPAKPVRTGAEEGSLPYSTVFSVLSFTSQWGVLTVAFEAGEGRQEQGALLNGARSTRTPGDWAQVLPLSAGVGADSPARTFRSVCVIRFEPTPGQQYLSPRRNLLYNGDLEAWTNPDLPDGFKRAPFASAETAAGLAADTAVKYEGERSLRLSLPDATLTHATAWRNYLAPAAPDGDYTFSVYLRAEPSAEVTVRCGGAETRATIGGQWQRCAATMSVAPGQALPAISLQKRSPGTLWVDAAQLEASSEATPFVRRPQETLFTPPPFPADLLAAEIGKLPAPGPLAGCGPEFSYYTREAGARLVYQVNLPAEQRREARLQFTITGADGRRLRQGQVPAPLPAWAIVSLPLADLPRGTATVHAELLVAGTVLARRDDALTKLPPAPAGAEVKINRHTRVLWRDGAPYLPVGSDASADLAGTVERIREEAALGLNHLHLWSGFHAPEKTAHGSVPRLDPQALVQILDAARDRGMTVTVNLSHWLSMNHFPQERFTNADVSDEEALRRALEVVRLVKGHPAVLGWHLIDEPDPAYCSPEYLGRLYREVKREDPYHPAEVNVCGTGLNMLAYRDSSDYMSIDIYPVPRAHPGLVGPNTRAMWLGGEWRPVRWWIQAWAELREPSAAEELGMTYQALVEGTRFVLFYNYRPSSYAAWAGVGQAAREVKALEPALAAQREALPKVETEGERVIASLHRAQGRTWIIAVNRDTKPARARLTLPPDCRARQAQVLFENREVACRDGVIAEEFPPLGRHVYELR